MRSVPAPSFSPCGVRLGRGHSQLVAAFAFGHADGSQGLHLGQDARLDRPARIDLAGFDDDRVVVPGGLGKQALGRLTRRLDRPGLDDELDREMDDPRPGIADGGREPDEQFRLLTLVAEEDVEQRARRLLEGDAVTAQHHHGADLAEDLELLVLALDAPPERVDELATQVPQQAPKHLPNHRVDEVQVLAVPAEDDDTLVRALGVHVPSLDPLQDLRVGLFTAGHSPDL